MSTAGLSFELTDEQRTLRETVRDFVERECPKPVARELEAAKEFPWELWRAMAEAGLHGIGIPERYGGQGGDVIDQTIVTEELSRSLGAVSSIWFITAFSGVRSVGLYGTEEQKRSMLPAIARGELMFAIALTEPGGGTDVLRAMRSRARRVDGGWLLNGTKIWSTCAHVADRLLIIARTGTGERASEGITVFVCDADQDGIRATPIPKLGFRCLGSCEIQIEDAFVPDDGVLGEVGRGWRQLTATLNNERILVAAICLGILRGVLEDAIAYAKQREAFDRPIGQFQAIQHMIADIAMWTETARLHTYRAAWLQQQGRPCAVESTIAKALASDYAVRAADAGIQILGGHGYSLEHDMQRYWRDARIYPIGPISNEMARNFIGEQLGLPRSF